MTEIRVVDCVEVHDYDDVVLYVCSDGIILAGPEGTPPWECAPLHQVRDAEGYMHVTLTRHGRKKSYLVHRLVAQHHVPGFRPSLAVHHLDKQPGHNSADNLACLTPGQHTILHHEKLTPRDARHIRELYAAGASQPDLAEVFEASVSSISRIVRGDLQPDAGGPVDRRGCQGERNSSARLREEDVLEIRARARAGEKYKALAEAFGVSVWAVRDVVYRHTWAWLPDEEERAA